MCTSSTRPFLRPLRNLALRSNGNLCGPRFTSELEPWLFPKNENETVVAKQMDVFSPQTGVNLLKQPAKL